MTPAHRLDELCRYRLNEALALVPATDRSPTHEARSEPPTCARLSSDYARSRLEPPTLSTFCLRDCFAAALAEDRRRRNGINAVVGHDAVGHVLLERGGERGGGFVHSDTGQDGAVLLGGNGLVQRVLAEDFDHGGADDVDRLSFLHWIRVKPRARPC